MSSSGAPFDAIVREILAQAYALAGGSQSAAARLLSISEKRLAELSKEYKLDQPPTPRRPAPRTTSAKTAPPAKKNAATKR
jgi:transposase